MGTEASNGSDSAVPTIVSTCESRRLAAGDSDLWVQPLCQNLELPGAAPLLPLSDGRLLTVDAAGISVSDDGGRTWTDRQVLLDGFNSNFFGLI